MANTGKYSRGVSRPVRGPGAIGNGGQSGSQQGNNTNRRPPPTPMPVTPPRAKPVMPPKPMPVTPPRGGGGYSGASQMGNNIGAFAKGGKIAPKRRK